MKIQLSHSVRVIDQEIHEVDLREPTGKDLMECGLPFVFHRGGEPDARILGALIGRLASNLTPDAVERLAARDFNALAAQVMGFLAPATSAPSSISTSRSDAGGEISTIS